MRILQQVVETGGQLLRVQAYAYHKRKQVDAAPALLLTFDVGRILIWGDAAGARIACEHIQDAEDVARKLVALDEKEPWWRVLGSSLARVEPITDPPGCRLQFRAERKNPRFIRLTLQGKLLYIELEKPAGTASPPKKAKKVG